MVFNVMYKSTYLHGHVIGHDGCIHEGPVGIFLQLVSLDVSKLRSQNSQVSHGLWGLLGFQILGELVEVAHNLPHKILRHLAGKQ